LAAAELEARQRRLRAAQIALPILTVQKQPLVVGEGAATLLLAVVATMRLQVVDLAGAVHILIQLEHLEHRVRVLLEAQGKLVVIIPAAAAAAQLRRAVAQPPPLAVAELAEQALIGFQLEIRTAAAAAAELEPCLAAELGEQAAAVTVAIALLDRTEQ